MALLSAKYGNVQPSQAQPGSQQDLREKPISAVTFYVERLLSDFYLLFP